MGIRIIIAATTRTEVLDSCSAWVTDHQSWKEWIKVESILFSYYLTHPAFLSHSSLRNGHSGTGFKNK